MNQSTWEPLENLRTAMELVDEYNNEHPFPKKLIGKKKKSNKKRRSKRITRKKRKPNTTSSRKKRRNWTTKRRIRPK